MCLGRLDIFSELVPWTSPSPFDDRLKISKYPNSEVGLRVHSCKRESSVEKERARLGARFDESLRQSSIRHPSFSRLRELASRRIDG